MLIRFCLSSSLVAVRNSSPGRPEPCEGNLVASAGSCGRLIVKHPWPLLEISLSDFRRLATLNMNTYLPTYLPASIICLLFHTVIFIVIFIFNEGCPSDEVVFQVTLKIMELVSFLRIFIAETLRKKKEAQIQAEAEAAQSSNKKKENKSKGLLGVFESVLKGLSSLSEKHETKPKNAFKMSNLKGSRSDLSNFWKDLGFEEGK